MYRILYKGKGECTFNAMQWDSLALRDRMYKEQPMQRVGNT